MVPIALSPETLQGILPAAGIGFLIALFCPMVALLLYFQSRPPSAPLPFKSKSEIMASVGVPLAMKSKAFPSTGSKIFHPLEHKAFVIPKTSNLLDESTETFEFPTLQPVSTLSARTREPIIREGSPIYLGSDSTRDSNTPELIPGVGNSSRPLRFQHANPHGWLRWAVGDSTVFATQEEELRAARYPGNIIGQEGLKNNMFFQYGLRYVPPLDAANVYRTIVIEDLPPHVTLDQILPQIRGGQIYCASLLDTTPRMLTGSPTAMITFVNQDGALVFLRRIAREGFYVGISRVRVRPVPTPTYLMSASMENEVLRNGRTRCLVVNSRNPTIKKTLHGVLAKSSFSTHVECFGERDGEGVATVRFHSIKVAMRAYELLMSQKMFQGVVKFDRDPCSL